MDPANTNFNPQAGSPARHDEDLSVEINIPHGAVVGDPNASIQPPANLVVDSVVVPATPQPQPSPATPSQGLPQDRFRQMPVAQNGTSVPYPNLQSQAAAQHENVPSLAGLDMVQSNPALQPAQPAVSVGLPNNQQRPVAAVQPPTPNPVRDQFQPHNFDIKPAPQGQPAAVAVPALTPMPQNYSQPTSKNAAPVQNGGIGAPRQSLSQPTAQPVQMQAAVAPQAINTTVEPVQKLPNKNLKFIVAGIIAVVSLGFIFAAYRVWDIRKSNYHNLPVAKVQEATQNNIAEVTEPNDGRLDLTNLVDATYATVAQDIEAPMNKQINMSNGYSFMVKNFEENWKGKVPKSSLPEKSNMFVKVDLVVGVREDDTEFFIDCNNFILQDASDRATKDEYIVDSYFANGETSDFKSDSTGNNTFKPGDQGEASCIFKVPKTSGPFSIAYVTEGYALDFSQDKTYGQSQKVELKAKVKLGDIQL